MQGTQQGSQSSNQQIDQFQKWIGGTNDPQQLAQVTKLIVGKIGSLPADESTRAVFARELGDDPRVATGFDRLLELSGTNAHA